MVNNNKAYIRSGERAILLSDSLQSHYLLLVFRIRVYTAVRLASPPYCCHHTAIGAAEEKLVENVQLSASSVRCLPPESDTVNAS